MAEPSKEDWQALLDKLRQRGTPSPAVAVAEPTGAPNPCMACEPKQLEQCGVFCRYQQASFAAIEARGVPEELAEHLFLPLVSGRAEGTGLGLALAQQVAREHRGTLSYRSRPGHTVFTVLLPLPGVEVGSG